ncbi:DUF6970 domain-containing protein [Flavobacterium daejeonense]|uniref:DUF6970 domain-containing protein n=1 Tax=Flavobacterium daejeonense TaxID=350893 RepID=UPI000478E869|nr:hypothetical protein [Flavobacterium daejeonense]
MKKALYIIVILIMFSCCSKNDDETIKNDYPECIKNQIETFLTNYPKPPDTGIRASVKKYSYKGQIVYVTDFSPGFPDGASAVINESCEAICQLGGFDGVQNDCVDFDKATFIKTVWIDKR